jgi:Domain of unknown function (DUF4259)
MSAAKGGRPAKARAASPSGIFENDDAGEWIEGFETDGPRAVEEALNAVGELEAGEYVEGQVAAYALAAAEVVAAARDGDDGRLPESLGEAMEEHREAINEGAFAKLALKAVTRVLKRSELKDQWDDDEDGEAQLEEVRELQERLRG